MGHQWPFQGGNDFFGNYTAQQFYFFIVLLLRLVTKKNKSQEVSKTSVSCFGKRRQIKPAMGHQWPVGPSSVKSIPGAQKLIQDFPKTSGTHILKLSFATQSTLVLDRCGQLQEKTQFSESYSKVEIFEHEIKENIP